jgi:hypothetical protein
VKPGRGQDSTWQSVASSALGDDLLLKVLSEVVDKRERAFLFAHIALDLPLTSVARTLGQDHREAEVIVGRLLARLQEDEELLATFSDVHRAGRVEHYLDLATRAGLQDWFCGYCKRFMMQPAVGRPRITCSENCRKRRQRNGDFPSAWERKGPAAGPQRPPALQASAHVAEAMRARLLSIIRRLNAEGDAGRTRPEIVIRDKAIILLAFTCPVQVSSATLSALPRKSVVETRQGIEVLFHWGSRHDKQYVTVPPDPDATLCPVRAVKSWNELRRENNYRDQALFAELFTAGGPTLYAGAPLNSRRITDLIGEAIRSSGPYPYQPLRPDDLLPAYLELASTGFEEQALRFSPQASTADIQESR